MTHAADNHATHATPAGLTDRFGSLWAWIAAAAPAGRRALHTVEAAHDARCNRDAFADEEVQDTGIDPTDATGHASWQPDLPFFMQGGFGRK